MRSAVPMLLLCIIYQHRVPAQERTRITHTDASVIRTMVFGFRDRQDSFVYTAKLVEELINGKDLAMDRSYDRDTSTLLYEGFTNPSLHIKTGVSRSYNHDGTLRMTIDHDLRTWMPADTTAYPNYSVLNAMKLKGDSVLRSIYGAAFCKAHLRWSLNSYYFDSAYAAEPSFALEWLRTGTKNKYGATEFDIRYDLIYEGHVYEDAIRLIMNHSGVLLQSHRWNEHWTIYNHGLEQPGKHPPGDFVLGGQEAIALAAKHGLRPADSLSVKSYLAWEALKGCEDQVYNGHYRMHVRQLLRRKSNAGRTYYRIWVFDPRTRSLLEKKKGYTQLDSVFGSNHQKRHKKNG